MKSLSNNFHSFREIHNQNYFLLRTIVIGWILERRTGKLGECEIWQHVPPESGVHDPTAGGERDPRHHREYLVRGRMQSEDDEPLTATGPLPQVLDQEEGVEDVQAVRGPVKGEDVRILQQSTG